MSKAPPSELLQLPFMQRALLRLACSPAPSAAAGSLRVAPALFFAMPWALVVAGHSYRHLAGRLIHPGVDPFDGDLRLLVSRVVERSRLPTDCPCFKLVFIVLSVAVVASAFV